MPVFRRVNDGCGKPLTMTTMTAQALALLISTHNCVPPVMVPVMIGIALHENHALDTQAVNHNSNGTDDIGVAQVNTSNFGWTGLTRVTAKDPCLNIAAAMKVWFARYNGNPPDYLKARYATGAIKAVESVGQSVTIPTTPAVHPLDILSRPARVGRDLLATR